VLVVTLEPATLAVQGDQVYRARQPSADLAAVPGIFTVCATWLSPWAHALAEAADVLVLCQSVDLDFLPLLRRRRLAGRLTVVEFNDNFLAPQAHNPVGAFYRNPINHSLARQLGALADRLQFSTPGLQDLFAGLNVHSDVLANALVDPTPVPRRHKRSASLRHGTRHLGWAGSAGHLEDIRWVLPCVQQVLAQRPDVSLHIMAPETLRTLFDWVPPGRLHFRSSGPFQDYVQFLRGLDVGLAPLLPTAFNRCRSDVKYVEYSMAGVPAVYSAGPAYANSVDDGATGLLATGCDDFTKSALRLLDDTELGDRLVNTAQQRICAQRGGAAMAARRLAFWRPKPAPIAEATPPPALDVLPADSRVADRHWVLPMGDVETWLHDGLLAGQTQHAVTTLRAAAKRAPTFYLPALYLGHAQADPGRAGAALQSALRLAPTSLATRFALAEHDRAHGRLSAAVAHVRAGAAQLPGPFGFAPLTELAGRLAAATEQPADAARYYAAALQQNPWYRPAATRLAQHHLAVRDSKAARTLLLENLARGSDTWVEHFLLGEIATHAAAWREARRHYTAARHRGGPAMSIGPCLANACLQLGDVSGARTALG
jgi:glycosyltransferase involved in cell wall biosynthesis/tetratricopeptide (TPR) repeat protein